MRVERSVAESSKRIGCHGLGSRLIAKLSKGHWQISHESDISKLKNGSFDLLIVDWSFLKKSEIQDQESILYKNNIIFSAPTWNKQDLGLVFAQSKSTVTHKFVCEEDPQEVIDSCLLKGFHQMEIAEIDRELKKTIQIQFKELQSITGNLNTIVDSRTQVLKESLKKLEDSKSRLRMRTQTLERLFETEDLEKWIWTLKSQLTPADPMRGPIVLIKTDKLNYIAHSLGPRVQENFVGDLGFSLNRDVKLLSEQAQSKLAATIQRPLGRVAGWALPTEEVEGVDLPGFGKTLQIYLLFEIVRTNLTSQKASQKALSNWVLPLSLSLMRVLVRERWASQLVLWEKTFESIKEPIALLQSDFQIIRCNSAFQRHLSEEKRCFEMFFGKAAPCDDCPMMGSSTSTQIKSLNSIFEVESFFLKELSSKNQNVFIHRYIDIAQERQQHSQDLQSEKMASLGLLAGNIAHELNNPLGGISSLCQLVLLEPNLSAGSREDVTEVLESAIRCQNIVKDLLEFVKTDPEQGVRTFDCGELIDKTLPFLKVVLREHLVRIERHDQGALLTGPFSMYQQVLFNLLHNAVQATESGGEIALHTKVNEAGKIALQVRDDGRGVDEQSLPKIFEAFFTTKPVGQGTGLGLSLSRAIMRRHGGELVFIPTEGKGACFEMQFK
ncbi:MAG: hypothetical protein COT74_03825 [Bdellovibrionales bacterium CG10_big_fil_rev_8_21_14_0_10_45_34]|nr:MAG: hypothetical protein COT74_03825 [Bdellovibrionales bacterium CG10_big_fil_rev_8_21_14_0_10_45_34]